MSSSGGFYPSWFRPTRLELPLLDPQVPSELGIVAAYLLMNRSASSRRMNVSTASPSGFGA